MNQDISQIETAILLGRKTVFTENVLQKLEEAFLMGCTDNEACLFADIAPASLYNYQQANPDFLERKKQLKENPVLKARQTVIDNLDNLQNAQWYLERKKKNEFAQRRENVNVDLPIPLFNLNELREDNSAKENSESVQKN